LHILVSIAVELDAVQDGYACGEQR